MIRLHQSPPESICLLRLSALGDVAHVVSIVRTAQTHWPQTRFTWIIGKREAELVGDPIADEPDRSDHR